MVPTVADDQDEFDGTVIATLRADEMSPARYSLASEGDMLENFARDLNNSATVTVKDNDAPVTRVAISTRAIVVDERSDKDGNPTGTFDFVAESRSNSRKLCTIGY